MIDKNECVVSYYDSGRGDSLRVPTMRIKGRGITDTYYEKNEKR